MSSAGDSYTYKALVSAWTSARRADTNLTEIIRRALSDGLEREDILDAAEDAGWDRRSAASRLCQILPPAAKDSRRGRRPAPDVIALARAITALPALAGKSPAEAGRLVVAAGKYIAGGKK